MGACFPEMGAQHRKHTGPCPAAPPKQPHSTSTSSRPPPTHQRGAGSQHLGTDPRRGRPRQGARAQQAQRHQVTHQLKAKAAGSAPRSATAVAPGKGNQHKTTPIRKPHNSAATRQHDPPWSPLGRTRALSLTRSTSTKKPKASHASESPPSETCACKKDRGRSVSCLELSNFPHPLTP